MEIVQEIVNIEGIKIPIIHSGGKIYYPLSYIEKHLIMSPRRWLTDKIKKEDRVKFTVDFGEDGDNNRQETNCSTEEEIVKALKRVKINNISGEQRRGQNKLRRYFNMSNIDKREMNVPYQIEWIGEEDFDSFTIGLIKRALKTHEDAKGFKCKSCDKMLPLTDNFFYSEPSNKLTGFSGSCIVCRRKGGYYISDNSYENYLKTRDVKLVEYYRSKNWVELFKGYSDRTIDRLPEEIYVRDTLDIIIDDLIRREKLNEENLSSGNLSKNFRIDIKRFGDTSMTSIYQRLYGAKFYLEKWKYPRYTFSGEVELTAAIAINIIRNYIEEKQVDVSDPMNVNYDKIVRECGITRINEIVGGMCGLYVELWDYKYAGYQYRNIGNYYKFDENNFLRDLKFLVEEDLKIKIEKIPLYVTRGLLNKEYKSMNTHLKRSGENLFYYYNQIYPGQFDEPDFVIGRYRNEFDSVEEQQVDDVLREYFDNVIYNYNDANKVTLKGKNPDWFIMTEKGVWLVEYFGMYIESQKNNPIVASYIETTHEKLELYSEMEGYNFLLVYQSDIEKDFLGLRAKVEKMKEKYGI